MCFDNGYVSLYLYMISLLWYFLIILNIAETASLQKAGDNNEGIPSSLITHLERAKYEKRMKKGKELEVLEDSETVKSFLHKADSLWQFVL